MCRVQEGEKRDREEKRKEKKGKGGRRKEEKGRDEGKEKR